MSQRSVTTQILPATQQGIETAARLLAEGGLVSFPTETVYGLGGDARSDLAVARIFEAKGRPSFNPLIAHVASLEAAQRFCELNETALKLAAAFWPGAITLVLPLKRDAGISKLVTAGLETIAVRVPNHKTALALLSAFDGPVAAPSANPSGRISPTQPEHVYAGLNGKIDAIVSGEACAIGVESTIISCLDTPVILRAGGIAREEIERVLGGALPSHVEGEVGAQSQEARLAPGLLSSHYAPNGLVRLNVTAPQEGETVLGFGDVKADINLSPQGDLAEAAATLFSALHQLDEMCARQIAVSPIPNHGLGVAINDRLKRAAAPRP